MHKRIVRVWCFCLYGSSMLACTASTPSAAKDAGAERTRCLTRGETYPRDTRLPRPVVDDKRNTPACTPSCGSTLDGDGYPDVSALPAGMCGKDDATCFMTAYEPCPCWPEGGPVSFFRCECSGGRWACVNIAAGARGCPACDAGS